jgi:gamma-glutamyl-gamma-aminobutyraldehyde dehydrogenase
VGKKIARQTADGLKKTLLELGGKSPNIVFDGSDVAKFAMGAAFTFTIHAGQGCALPTRILAERAIYDEVVDGLSAALARIKVGDPTDAKTGMGPLIREVQRERVERYVATGTEEGARLAFGGGRPAGLDKGFFVEPTLFADVDNAMTVAQEEIFGPVGAVIPFKGIDQALEIANDSIYGLTSSIWTKDLNTAIRAARDLETGVVWVNCFDHGDMTQPWGGYKQTGSGRDKCLETLSHYTQTKSVWIHLG